MADNYLEKRMADYRDGKLSASTRKPAYEKGMLCFKMPPLVVLVVGLPDSATLGAVELLVKCGCKVALVHAERRKGNVMAQTTGALYYPVSRVDVESVRSASDFVKRRWEREISLIIISPDCPMAAEGLYDLYRLVPASGLISMVSGENASCLTPVSSEIVVRYDESSSVQASMLCAFMSLPVNRALMPRTFDLRAGL